MKVHRIMAASKCIGPTEGLRPLVFARSVILKTAQYVMREGLPALTEPRDSAQSLVERRVLLGRRATATTQGETQGARSVGLRSDCQQARA
jgi:hypothetical protein